MFQHYNGDEVCSVIAALLRNLKLQKKKNHKNIFFQGDRGLEVRDKNFRFAISSGFSTQNSTIKAF